MNEPRGLKIRPPWGVHYARRPTCSRSPLVTPRGAPNDRVGRKSPPESDTAGRAAPIGVNGALGQLDEIATSIAGVWLDGQRTRGEERTRTAERRRRRTGQARGRHYRLCSTCHVDLYFTVQIHPCLPSLHRACMVTTRYIDGLVTMYMSEDRPSLQHSSTTMLCLCCTSARRLAPSHHRRRFAWVRVLRPSVCSSRPVNVPPRRPTVRRPRVQTLCFGSKRPPQNPSTSFAQISNSSRSRSGASRRQGCIVPSVETARGTGAPPLERARDDTRRDAPQTPDGDEIRAFPTRACALRRETTVAGCSTLGLPAPVFLRRLCEVRRTASAKSSEIGRNRMKSTLFDRFSKSVLRAGDDTVGSVSIAAVPGSVGEAARLRVVEFWAHLCLAAGC